jgi:hypothetical protein
MTVLAVGIAGRLMHYPRLAMHPAAGGNPPVARPRTGAWPAPGLRCPTGRATEDDAHLAACTAYLSALSVSPAAFKHRNEGAVGRATIQIAATGFAPRRQQVSRDRDADRPLGPDTCF